MSTRSMSMFTLLLLSKNSVYPSLRGAGVLPAVSVAKKESLPEGSRGKDWKGASGLLIVRQRLAESLSD